MKTVIVYYSQHHGNTKKLLDAIAAQADVTLYDVTTSKAIDLSEYDRIGFASGVYFSKYNKNLLAFAQEHLPTGKAVFFLHTAGDPRENQNAAIKAITDAKGCKDLGSYYCKGFDTFGPFKLVGGIAKGHPTGDEIVDAVAFYQALAGDGSMERQEQ